MSIRAAMPASKRSRAVMIGESPVASAMRLASERTSRIAPLLDAAVTVALMASV
jgi:hypothetical protein